MVRSVSYKLNALRDIQFPNLEFTAYRVGLTPYQVREYNKANPDKPLPESPEPEYETEESNGQKTRRDRWREKWDLGQVEIDALATLAPALLTQMAEQAILSFHDATLTRRTSNVQGRWLTDCQQAVEDQEGPEQAERRQEVADRLAEINEEVEALIESVEVDLDDFDLPDRPELPQAVVNPKRLEPQMLLDSSWPLDEKLLRLKASRAYTPWQDEGRVR